MKAVSSTTGREAGLDKLRSILDLTLPVVEREVNVVTQVVDHVLSGVRMAHQCHPLIAQLLDPVLDPVELGSHHRLLVSSVEPDYCLEHFLVAQTGSLGF